MKVKLYLAMMAAALVMTNCSNDDEMNQSSQGGKGTITAFIEGASRSAVTDTGVFSWADDDKISVWTGSASDTYTFDATTTNSFTAPEGAGTPTGYAFYPANGNHKVTEGSVTFNMPTEYSHGSTNAPMLAAIPTGSDNLTLTFKHLGGLMRFIVKDVPSGVTSFKFKANKKITGEFTVTEKDGENVIEAAEGTDANEVTINFTAPTEATTMTFYVPMPVGEYGDYTVTVGDKSHTSTNVTNTINRRTLLLMPTFTYTDNELVKGEGNTIVMEAEEQSMDISGDQELVIEAPESTEAGDVEAVLNLNYTPSESDASLSLSDGNDENAESSEESEATVNVTVPATATIATLNIATPSMTVALNAADGAEVTYTEVTALTAQNTLKIGKGVKVSTLKIKGGHVEIEDGGAVTTINRDDNNADEFTFVTFKGGIPNEASEIDNIVYLSVENDSLVAYVSDADALEAVLANAKVQKIVLNKDITLNKGLVFSQQNNGIVIDGNTKTIAFTAGTDSRLIDVKKETEGMNFTLKNITIENRISWVQRVINYNTYGTLTLDNVTITHADGCTANYAVNLPGVSNNCTVVINNCNIGATANALNIWGKNVKADVTNSDLYVIDNSEKESYSVIALNNDGAGSSADGTVVNVTGGSLKATGTHAEGSDAVRNNTETGVVNISTSTEVVGEIEEMVAIVHYTGSTDYYSKQTLAGAIETAKETNAAGVRLIRDVEVSDVMTINSNIVLDGNNFTVTVASEDLQSNLVFDSQCNSTIKNLNITGTPMTKYNDTKVTRGLYYSKSGTYVVDNVHVSGVGYALNVNVNDYSLTVKNSTLEGWSSWSETEQAVTFENVYFKTGTYYTEAFGEGYEDYNKHIRPYAPTIFSGCTFDQGFILSLSYLGDDEKVTMKSCKVGDVVLTADNISTYLEVSDTAKVSFE